MATEVGNVDGDAAKRGEQLTDDGAVGTTVLTELEASVAGLRVAPLASRVALVAFVTGYDGQRTDSGELGAGAGGSVVGTPVSGRESWCSVVVAGLVHEFALRTFAGVSESGVKSATDDGFGHDSAAAVGVKSESLRRSARGHRLGGQATERPRSDGEGGGERRAHKQAVRSGGGATWRRWNDK